MTGEGRGVATYTATGSARWPPGRRAGPGSRAARPGSAAWWPGRRMSRVAGLAAVLPAALVEGEDDALAGVAAFQLAGRLRGLLPGHGFVRAPAEPGLGAPGGRVI